jgi:hypothetical protein
MFELHSLNRKINRTSVARIKKSMKKYGYVEAYPMHVCKNGKKLKIVAGHHRFVAASELGIPVHYIIVEESCDIFDMETSGTAWKSADFIEAYSKAGYPEYVRIVEFAETYGLNRYIAARLLHNVTYMDSGGSSPTTGINMSIKNGTYKARTVDFAVKVATIVNVMESCGIDFAKKSPFISAVAACCATKEFDSERFLKQVRLFPKMAINRGDRDGFLEEIEKIYTYRAHSTHKIPLAFLAKSASKERSASK